jgi:hypothetical protein
MKRKDEEIVYTFWEGQMPAYIKFCLETWQFPFTVLNYDNLNEHTDIDIESVQQYSLPQISDIVRAHVLRDNGGWWLDADTIMVTDKLMAENVIGTLETRHCDTGVCHGEKGDDFFVQWAEYQDKQIGKPSTGWSMFVNDFTDKYIREHEEIQIYDVKRCCPELRYWSPWNHEVRYQKFYFEDERHLADFPDVEMFVLHNSWTPQMFKWGRSEMDIFYGRCTMSNLLREVRMQWREKRSDG